MDHRDAYSPSLNSSPYPPPPPLLRPPHAPGPPPPHAPWQMLTAVLRPGSPGRLWRRGSSMISSPLSTEGWFQKFSNVLGRAMVLMALGRRTLSQRGGGRVVGPPLPVQCP